MTTVRLTDLTPEQLRAVRALWELEDAPPVVRRTARTASDMETPPAEADGADRPAAQLGDHRER